MRRPSHLKQTVTLLLAVLLAVPAWTVSPSSPQLPNPGSAGMSREDQQKLGLQAMAEVYKQMPVLPDSSPITQYVQGLGKKLAKQIPQQYTWPYQFHVVQQKEINAFALPGGPMFVNVGTINAAQNEAQLAGVMSHEMAHVYMQHSAKRATSPKTTIAQIVGALGGIFGGSTLGNLARMGIQFGAGTLLLKYSREDEDQADAVGAIIAYKADYNPMELANFFEILAKQSGGGGPQFLSDHPNPGNRSEAIAKQSQNWPPENYITASASFDDAKKQAGSVKAYTAQEIADGAKQGVWAKQNKKAGAIPASVSQTVGSGEAPESMGNVSFEDIRPSDRFTEVHQNGFSISYPSNWGTASGQNSITIAPKAGVAQNAIAYGAMVSILQAPAGASLDQVAQDLIQNLQQSNPGLHPNGGVRSVTVAGVEGRSADLFGNSPIQQNGQALAEHDWLVVVPRPGGDYLYSVFISPENDFTRLRPTFKKMLESLRLQ